VPKEHLKKAIKTPSKICAGCVETKFGASPEASTRVSGTTRGEHWCAAWLRDPNSLSAGSIRSAVAEDDADLEKDRLPETTRAGNQRGGAGHLTVCDRIASAIALAFLGRCD
jgi:hypothetical protein